MDKDRSGESHDSRDDRAALLVAVPTISACAPWLVFLQAHQGGTSRLVGLVVAWVMALIPLAGAVCATRYAVRRCAPRTWVPLVPVVLVGAWFGTSYVLVSWSDFHSPGGYGLVVPNVFLDGVAVYGVVLGWFVPPVVAVMGGLHALRRS